jgi:threonine/homoserine/homoserine lactone efflux protein
MVIALILGAVVGFISAVPVAGPISAVIFSRGMQGKYAQGRWIAVGAGAVEGIYAFLAFWGFHHFLSDLTLAITISKSVGAALLFGLGFYFFRSKKMRKHAGAPKSTQVHEPKAILMGAGMSAINPSLIASWTITASTLHSMNLFKFSTTACAALAVGVCIGIVAWFTLLLKIMSNHRNEIDAKMLDRGLKGIGILLFALSGWMLLKLFVLD